MYRERLTPRPVIWVVLGGFAGTVSIAYAAALGIPIGISVGLGLITLMYAVLWWTSPVLTVSPMYVTAGPASLPIQSIAETTILDSEGLRLARDGRHPDADARSYTLIRPWAGNAGVMITLKDDADPHPSWVLSSRHPADLVAAIHAAR